MKKLPMHGKDSQIRTTKDDVSETAEQVVNREFNKKNSYKKIKDLLKKKK